jgi:dTDP-4-amino-4,6-dideoxygalactose transaminase
MIKFLDLYKQYEGVRSEMDAAIADVIRDSAFVAGKYAKQFEEAFARFLGVKFCLGVGNGTDAIEIALRALDLPAGAEVLVPANTFIATSESVTSMGLRVRFCDCDPQTYTISVKDARSKMGPNVKAMIPVHLYGHAADMNGVMELAREFSLKVIEDCAQAQGAEYQGKKVGGFGDLATFSFYPGKNLGAYGDAGAIVTNDEALLNQCRLIANHGRVSHYDHLIEGRNSRLDGIQAAVLSVKLRHLESWNEARRQVAAWYDEALRGIPEIDLPVSAAWTKPVWHLYVIRVRGREELKAFLSKNGVETGVHYPIALPKMKAYEYLGQAAEPMWANTTDTELLSLPIHENITKEDVATIADLIKQWLKR